MFKVGAVVQFNEKHKWAGCLGFIVEAKRYGDGEVRYMVGVPVPEQGIAYIYVTGSAQEIEFIGNAILFPASRIEDCEDD